MEFCIDIKQIFRPEVLPERCSGGYGVQITQQRYHRQLASVCDWHVLVRISEVMG